MKLEGTYDGSVYGSSGRTILVGAVETVHSPEGTPTRHSKLPEPSPLVERALVSAPGRRILERVVGKYLTTNVWRLAPDRWLASVGRTVYVSHDDGKTWLTSLALPESSGLRGLMPAGVCVDEDSIFLGEYPLAEDTTPRILRSDDDGLTWETAVALPDVRHVHAVQVDPYTGDRWVATGDRDPACRIGRLQDGEFEVVVEGSQRYRATELAFTPDAILWGVDCAYLDSNELLRLDREDLSRDNPTPDVVGTVDSSVYHAATLSVDGEMWVAFATAGEIGGDRTAPETTTTQSQVRRGPRVVAASSATDYTTWHELRAYGHTRCLADVPGANRLLPRSNAYVFLDSHPDHGLLINPYNAIPDDGRLDVIPLDHFRELDAKAGRAIH